MERDFFQWYFDIVYGVKDELWRDRKNIKCKTILCLRNEYRNRINYYENGDYDVYFIVDEYGGVQSDLKIDDNHITISQDLYIDNKEKDLVLVLSSGDFPTLWNIHYTEGTRIRAIIAGGEYNQALKGMSQDTIIYNSNYTGYIKKKKL